MLIHVFQPGFAEISKAEVTKWVHGIHHKNGWYFAPFSGGSGASHQKFYMISLFPFPIPLSSFVQICPVFEEIYPKMSSRLSSVQFSIGVYLRPFL